MRTLIVSDLHLGNGGPYDAFAGEDALPALLDRVAAAPARVIVNGDGVDFLMNDDPLELDRGRAAAQARAIAESRAGRAVLAAFGRVLARGGEVVLRLGNHDVELALPEVQAALREALGQPTAIAARLAFERGDAPAICDVGGARVLVTHGEHGDPWNRVDYGALDRVDGYTYAPGSTLVKRLLNPITKDYGMRFVNLLKPDFQGGVLTALAVEPGVVKQAFQGASVSILWHLFRRARGPLAFAADDDLDLGLADRLAEAGLTEEELEELEAMVGDGPTSFAGGDELPGRVKLARTALSAYAGLQRRLAGSAGDAYFQLDPDAAEWAEAGRLAAAHGAGAVIFGHTHAARWRAADGVVFANTGTWIELMQLPPYDAGDEAWAEFLAELGQNPGLAAARQRAARTRTRFTAALVEPAPSGGASVSLVEWGPRGLEKLGEAPVASTKGAR